MLLKYKIAFIILFSSLGCTGDADKQVKESIPPTPEISRIRLTDLNGNRIDLAKLNGKAVFINFWATWCRPCLEEMPSIGKAMEGFSEKNIEFLFASNESKEQIEKFKSTHAYPFNYVIVENMEALQIMSLPTTYIFNTQGKLVFSEMGYRKWDTKENIDLILNSIQ